MFEANCLQEPPARIVARVLKQREPCLVSARPGERGVLVPYEERYLPLLEAHPRVLDALLKDLKKAGTDMAMYCLQVGITQEQDAFRYLDGNGRPVLAMLGVKRFQRWAKKQGASGTRAPAKKKAPVKKASSPRTAGKHKPTTTRRTAPAARTTANAAPAGKKAAPRQRRTIPRR